MKLPAKIGIAGIGLMGGSIALAVRKSLPLCHVIGYDIAPDTLAHARRQNIVLLASDRLEGLLECDFVFVCVPLNRARTITESLLDTARGNVIDIASVKSPLVPLTAHANASRLVFTHPLAGKEQSGIEHADASLFEGRKWAICPHERNDETVLQDMASLIGMLGAEVSHVPLEDHDRIAARTSHLPQLLSTLLAASLQESETNIESMRALSGPGFLSMTRLAGSPYLLWSEIFAANRAEILAAWSEFNRTTGTNPLAGESRLWELFSHANQLYLETRLK